MDSSPTQTRDLSVQQQQLADTQIELLLAREQQRGLSEVKREERREKQLKTLTWQTVKRLLKLKLKHAPNSKCVGVNGISLAQ